MDDIDIVSVSLMECIKNVGLDGTGTEMEWLLSMRTTEAMVGL